ncbi:MAG: hypothetical protein HND53_13240 [Proteobacteria bacterium]|nr:hypothetical protein [Pseudomonadota bacterium]NOG61461.1 hypothetical protein [Pseudomonadota bacterium]
MNTAVFGLTLTYVALAGLLLGIFLLTRLPVWIKLSCVLLISSFYYLTFYSLQGLLGWPTQQELPAHFQLMASSVTEPDDKTGESGSIHIWATSFVDNKPAKEPRAYELAYDFDLHAALEEALNKQRQGNVQLGRRLEVDNSEDVPRDWTRYGQKRQKIKFFDLPDPELPEK